MNVVVASDHAGFAQKQAIVKHLVAQDLAVSDLGPNSDARVDYPDFAQAVAQAVACGSADRGILVCGTGIGMAIAANKVAGVRAANVTSPLFAALAREHNDANIVALSGRYVSLEDNLAIVESFLATDFAAGRHAGRVAKIG
jgi:ribose 5-phosphate isomerase B